MKRKNGFYWVHDKRDGWLVAEWIEDRFYECGDACGYEERWYDHVSEPLTAPEVPAA